MPDDRRVAVLGAGMHPWGKWGRNFVEYGLAAAGDALAEAGLPWTDIQYVAGADTIRNGYPGFIAGATFAQALGWTGARVSSAYAACASGAQAINNARAQILAGLCDVALVVGADTTPKGFFAPVGGERKDDPDWLRFHLLGATNPTYFALYARRRMELFGATEADFAAVKVKNARARPGEPQRPLPQGGHRRRRAGLPHGGRPAAPARDLRHLRRRGGPGALQSWSSPGVTPAPTTWSPSTPSPPSRRRFPQTVIEMPELHHRLGGDRRLRSGPASSSRWPSPPTRRPGIGPEDVEPGRGLRPVLGPRARLVRGHRPVQGG